MNKIGKLVGCSIATTAVALSLVYGPNYITKAELTYTPTGAEQVANNEFESNLKAIYENYSINFKNADLYNVIAAKLGQNFSVDELRSIKSLELNLSTFANKDLSDIKYLINLERITLYNGLIDCQELTYNQNLTTVTLDHCDTINSQKLPNSISNLTLTNTKALDALITAPYFCKEITLNNTVFNKIHLKNPERLESMSFNGYSIFDLNDIASCENLKYLRLTQCPNIKNGNVLKKFEKMTQLDLDEFCCVWGSRDMIKDLPQKYRKIMKKLEDIAEGITLPNMTDEEKIEHITLFVTSQIDYDFESLNIEKLLTDYNTKPLTHALEDRKGVCVGYATFFTALANRVGLDSYQPDSVNHTWNMVKTASSLEYRAYDLTQLDNPGVILGTFSDNEFFENQKLSKIINDGKANDLLFYNFDYREAPTTGYNYNTNVEKINVTDIDENIGYVNVKATSVEQDNKISRIKIASADAAIILIIVLILNSLNKDKKKEKEMQTKVKRRYATTYKDFI